VDENALLRRARRIREERETQLLEDKVLTFAEVEEAATEILTAIRIMVLGMGDAIAAELPHLTRDDIEQVRVVCRKLLRNASVAAWENDPNKLPPPLPARIAERQGTGEGDD
jgi:glutamyl-tRNA reductase